ncbi:MAG: hypothetical protein JO302_07515 [Candidatus Eremiobacteraeota bacterium]|nr:hypothetical protein [Candidatus Eremiobacteraeota bacterium]
MFSALGLTMALAVPVTRLEIQPWTGRDLVTTTTSAAKFRLIVTGKPGAHVRLQATGVADGWLGAFCTPTVCSPQSVDADLPSSGTAVLQFELIREEDSAPNRSGARITGDDGAFVDVPAVSR